MKRKPYIRPEIEIIPIESEGVILGSPGNSQSSLSFDNDDEGSVDRKPRGREWADYEAF